MSRSPCTFRSQTDFSNDSQLPWPGAVQSRKNHLAPRLWIREEVNSPNPKIKIDQKNGTKMNKNVHIISKVFITSALFSLAVIPAPGPASADNPENLRRQAGEVSDGPIEGMRFAYIPAGSFVMGSPEDEKGRLNRAANYEGPQHDVTVSSFEMMTTEVTQGMWRAVMGKTVVEQRDKANPEWALHGVGDSYPIYYVSRFEAEEFAAAINRLDPGKGYRLPTEAEWEYACRAGTTTRFFWGDDLDNSETREYGWIGLMKESTSYPVGQKKPNGWGLYDMLGNVFEWASDWLAPYSSEAATNPVGPATGSVGVIRGGDWYHDDQTARSAARGNSFPQNARYTSGLRLVRSSG